MSAPRLAHHQLRISWDPPAYKAKVSKALQLARSFTSTAAIFSTDTPVQPAKTSPDPRWLSDIKLRLGTCIAFGLDEAQQVEARSLLKILAEDWRELLVGSEGFLTAADRRGLYRQQVVWGEMVGHVNNVTYARYAESARINWANNYALYIDPKHRKQWGELWTSDGTGLILRSIRTDFKFPMTWPDRVTVYHKLRTAPDADIDSFLLDAVILSEKHQRPAARCLEDIVVYDYTKGCKATLRPFIKDMMEDTFRKQEDAKRDNLSKGKILCDRVKRLEKVSWDRPDAVEDVGTAGG